jgi:nicotinate-nucleotide adenylyltransferase
MHVGLFGGTFDPPHIGHLVVAEWMRDAFALDEVLWVPAARSPHKVDRTPASSDLRLKMVRAAMEGHDGFAVSDTEIRRGGSSFTVDTLRELTTERPEDRFSLLMGSDTLAGFPRWRDPRVILTMADLLVFKRPGAEGPSLPDWLAPKVRFTDAPLIGVSASLIRQRCADGRSIRYLVPASVQEIITTHGLYR